MPLGSFKTVSTSAENKFPPPKTKTLIDFKTQKSQQKKLYSNSVPSQLTCQPTPSQLFKPRIHRQLRQQQKILQFFLYFLCPTTKISQFSSICICMHNISL